MKLLTERLGQLKLPLVLLEEIQHSFQILCSRPFRIEKTLSENREKLRAFTCRFTVTEGMAASAADALAGKIVVSEEQRAAAGCAYFITQRCTLIRSQFNPHREQLVEWVTQEPEAIWGLPETADLRTALLTRQPLSMIRYQRLASL